MTPETRPTDQTSPSTGPIRPGIPPRPRYAFWIIGALLWVVALGSLWGMWAKGKEAQKARELAEQNETNPPVKAPEQEPAQETDLPNMVVQVNEDGSKTLADVWDPEGIADFNLISSEKKDVTKQDLLGKPWVVNFMFTHCAGTCPKIVNQMRDLNERLKGLDVRLVSLTVDPLRDTPEQLANYSSIFREDPDRWYFLTGEQEEIYNLIAKSFKMPVKELEGDERRPGFEFIHSNNIMLVNSEGVVVGKYNALVEEEMAELRMKIQDLVEADKQKSVSETREPLAAPIPNAGE